MSQQNSTIRCRICDRPLKSEESIRRGAGRVCLSHEPPQWINNYPSDRVKKMVIDAYGSIRSSGILLREGQQHDALYLAHLGVEKMLKALKVDTSGKYQHVHVLPDILKEMPFYEDAPEWIKDFLADLHPFQTAGRYPLEKEKLLRSTDPEFIKNVTSNSEKVMLWLSNQLSLKPPEDTSKN